MLWHYHDSCQDWRYCFSPSDPWQQRAPRYDGESPGTHPPKPPAENQVSVPLLSCKKVNYFQILLWDDCDLHMESILFAVISKHLKWLFYRRKRYVHRCKLDWDVHSSSGRYVRKHCKPLKVRGIILKADTYSQSAPVLINNHICKCICIPQVLKKKK